MDKPTTPVKTPSMNTSKPPSPPEDDIVHFVGYDVVTLRDDDEIETLARSTLMSTLESAEHGAAGNANAYGNPLGLAVLSDLHDQKRRLASLEHWKAEAENWKAEAENWKAETENWKAEAKIQISQLQSDNETFKIAAEGYRKIRNRFLDIFRRDVIDNLDHKGRHNIAKGNEAAHYGDAVADAALYTSRERLDYDVMLKIYGLNPRYITSLAKAGNSDTIKVINAGATWRANQSTTAVPPEVEAAFQTFLNELTLSQNPNDESLTDGTTYLSKAYYAFWTAHKVHKAHK